MTKLRYLKNFIILIIFKNKPDISDLKQLNSFRT